MWASFLRVIEALQGRAFFARTVAINNATFREVVWRKFYVNSITGQNPDPVTAHSPGKMREDDVTIIELDRKCRTRKDLFDAAGHLDWALFGVLRRVRFRLTPTLFSNSITSGYGNTP